MTTLTVTAKGQVTLRKDILAHLGVSPGDQINVQKLPDGRIEVRAPLGGDISAVFNLLKRPDGPTLTLDEIAEAAASGWADQG